MKCISSRMIPHPFNANAKNKTVDSDASPDFTDFTDFISCRGFVSPAGSVSDGIFGDVSIGVTTCALTCVSPIDTASPFPDKAPA